MRKGYLCLIAVLLLMTACKRKKSLPEGILPREQMQEIIWDLTTAGEFLNGFIYSRDTSVQQTPLSEAWYKKVYSLHHITREKFLQSYVYYQQHPELMREVLDSLAKREQPAPSLLEYSQKIVPDSVADKFLPPAQRRADSLRRLPQGSAGGRVQMPDRIKADSMRARFQRPTNAVMDSVRRARELSRRANLERARLKAMKKK